MRRTTWTANETHLAPRRLDKVIVAEHARSSHKERGGLVRHCLVLALSLLTTLSSGAAQTSTDATIRSLQTHLKIYPTDFKAYDQLGAALIQKGRETADASYYELAKEALSKSLDLVSNDPAAASAKTHMAVLAMAEHQFQEALTWAQDALALGAGDPTPWAIVGDALADMGEYDRAAEAYARVRDPLRAGEDASGVVYERDSRVAYLGFLRGDAQSAIRLMRDAIARATSLRLPVENLAWSQYQLGEFYFKSGDLAGAEQAYAAGLAIDPHSYRNLAGLGEVRAAQARYPEAIALYQKAIAVVPFPAYAAALYDLYLQVGRSDEARKQLALVEFISTLNPINERLFYRELALFYADHNLKLNASVDLARKELDVRHDIYTWDILAWVLFKSGNFPEAAKAMKKALALGTQDALLDFHAAIIEFQQGRSEHAGMLLQRALALNPNFHLIYAGQAREMLGQLVESGAQKLGAGSPAARDSRPGGSLE
jgi:tetratricopeptide (TPR) repeat protein